MKINIYFKLSTASVIMLFLCGSVYAQDIKVISGEVHQGETSESGYLDYSFGTEDNIPVMMSYEIEETLPSKYDSRDYGYVTSVKNQWEEGCCWAFACIGAVESNLIKKGLVSKEDADYSESHAAWFGVNSFDNKYKDGRKINNPYSLGGNDLFFRSAMTKRSGPELEKNSKYDERDANHQEIQRFESVACLKTSMTYPITDRNAIKKAIMDYGSVTYSLYYSGKDYLNNSTGAYNCTSAENGNHEVLVVGWDDDYLADNFKDKPESSGAWIAKNSYGDKYCNGGYFMISYENKSNNCYATSYDIESEADYDNLYMYDGSGCNGYIYIYKDETDAPQRPVMANVFKAENDEELKAAAFSTFEAAEYEIHVYKGNPMEGGAECTEALTTGIVQYPGYYEIDLADSVALKQGEVFTVAVVMDEGKSIPIEYVSISQNPALNFYVNSEEGQSIVGAWVNENIKQASLDRDKLGNVGVKAMTDDVGDAPKRVIFDKLQYAVGMIEKKFSDSDNEELKGKMQEARAVTTEQSKSEINNAYLELLTAYKRSTGMNYIITSDINNGVLKAEIVLLDNSDGDSLLLAYYDENGRLIKAETKQYAPDIAEYDFGNVPAKTKSYKIMMWNNGITPAALCSENITDIYKAEG